MPWRALRGDLNAVGQHVVDNHPAVLAQHSRDLCIPQQGRCRRIVAFDQRRRWVPMRHHAHFVRPSAANVQLTGNRARLMRKTPTGRRRTRRRSIRFGVSCHAPDQGNRGAIAGSEVTAVASRATADQRLRDSVVAGKSADSSASLGRIPTASATSARALFQARRFCAFAVARRNRTYLKRPRSQASPLTSSWRVSITSSTTCA